MVAGEGGGDEQGGAAGGKAKPKTRPVETLLTERLLAVLRREVRALEGGAETGEKARIDAIALATRTLEKLIELKRLDGAEAADSEGDEAEGRRLRDELMRRLRLIDEARGGRLLGDAGAARG